MCVYVYVCVCVRALLRNPSYLYPVFYRLSYEEQMISLVLTIGEIVTSLLCNKIKNIKFKEEKERLI